MDIYTIHCNYISSTAAVMSKSRLGFFFLIEQHLRHVTVLMLQLCVLKICEMVECGLCIYVCIDFCEMLLSPLNMESVLVGLNPSGQFYDTVCIVQPDAEVRLFSEYLLNFIVVARDNFRIKF